MTPRSCRSYRSAHSAAQGQAEAETARDRYPAVRPSADQRLRIETPGRFRHGPRDGFRNGWRGPIGDGLDVVQPLPTPIAAHSFRRCHRLFEKARSAHPTELLHQLAAVVVPPRTARNLGGCPAPAPRVFRARLYAMLAHGRTTAQPALSAVRQGLLGRADQRALLLKFVQAIELSQAPCVVPAARRRRAVELGRS